MDSATGATTPKYDLKALLRKAGRGTYTGLSVSENRKTSEVDVEILEEESSEVIAPPLPVHAFVDGIQAQLLVTFRQHRPVVLAYTAAGAACHGPELSAVKERVNILCAEDDREWVSTINPQEHPVPTATVPNGTPPDVERSVLERVGILRAACESELCTEMLSTLHEGEVVVVDGSLQGKENSPQLVGVVKTSRTRYLDDESYLYQLPVGWRSPIFKIAAQANTAARYSTYLRLNSANHESWAFGLIRLEAFDVDQLEPLAARALRERQSKSSGDARWDRHLASVATCEKLLRARRPVVFDLFK